ncbi:MAG: ketopantoate reductase C-terminal domain-containing protein, partial [Chloroflexota bacterium]
NTQDAFGGWCVQRMFQRAQIAHETPSDMQRELWWKFMANVAVNQSSAVLRMPYGVLRTTPAALELINGLAGEVLALAAAANVNLTSDDLDLFYEVLGTIDPLGKTSMLQDVEAGRTNEVEIFAGKVVALGEVYSLPTPFNTTFLHILRGLQPTQ